MCPLFGFIFAYFKAVCVSALTSVTFIYVLWSESPCPSSNLLSPLCAFTLSCIVVLGLYGFSWVFFFNRSDSLPPAPI